MPDIALGSQLASVAMTLQLAGGTFAIDDIPTLALQMQEMAASLSRNVLPRLAPLLSAPILPVVNLAVLARLVLQLKALGIDPVTLATAPPPAATPPGTFAVRLTPPQIAAMKLAVGLPPIAALAETLKVPLGDQALAATMRNHFAMLAKLEPPRLPIAMPALLRLPVLIEALAVIEEAFGAGATTPAGLARIQASLTPWLRLALPVPLPALKLAETLPLLPPPEAVRAGTALANAPMWGKMAFTPPRIAVMPFLNVALALKGSLQQLLGIPVLDACDACALGGEVLAGALG
jgi:hypothetical protein